MLCGSLRARPARGRLLYLGAFLRYVACGLLAAAAAGCDQQELVTTTPLGPQRPGLAADGAHCVGLEEVEVFYVKTPGRDYEEVAIVHAVGKQDTSDNRLVTLLRLEATKVCADAIVGIAYTTKRRPVPGRFLCEHNCDYDATDARGVAIRFAEPVAVD